MSNILFINSIRFIVLILAQVLICNHINLLGYINPYIYIIFILLFPIRAYRIPLILISFFLGLIIDIFSDSLGVHAASSVVLAYARPLMLKTAFGVKYEYQTVKIEDTAKGNLLLYILFAVIVHHAILFSLEIFSFSKSILILKNTAFSTIFTTVISLLIILLFNRNKA